MSKIDERQLREVAAHIKDNWPTVSPLNFYSLTIDGREVVQDDMYPPVGHEYGLDFFFVACIQQFGFWLSDAAGYTAPLLGTLRGRSLKGSDLLWQVLKRQFDADPEWFTPARLAKLTLEEWYGVTSDDNGRVEWPDAPRRVELLRAYGERMLQTDQTPRRFVRTADINTKPMTALMTELRKLPGFSGDMFAKKAALLAMVLVSRPEHWLTPTLTEPQPPAIDYHLMRLMLRLGVISLSRDEAAVSRDRRFCSATTELNIRSQTYEAFLRLARLTGLDIAALDNLFWQARRYCPETTEPDCSRCYFQAACMQRVDLFQPVYRTTSY